MTKNAMSTVQVSVVTTSWERVFGAWVVTLIASCFHKYVALDVHCSMV